MAEQMVEQWLIENSDGSFEVLWSDPPGKPDKLVGGQHLTFEQAQAQATHFITIPQSQAGRHYELADIQPFLAAD